MKPSPDSDEPNQHFPWLRPVLLRFPLSEGCTPRVTEPVDLFCQCKIEQDSCEIGNRTINGCYQKCSARVVFLSHCTSLPIMVVAGTILLGRKELIS